MSPLIAIGEVKLTAILIVPVLSVVRVDGDGMVVYV